ncbi:MAG: hypothetical protein L3K13_06695 [Thermoplasmata archaeon]|nr:hypothetical protein [Thermoplasmata archaeon]
MSGSHIAGPSHLSRSATMRTIALVAIAAAVLLVPALVFSGGTAPLARAPSAHVHPALARSASGHPLSNSTTCYDLNKTVCVQVVPPATGVSPSPDIIPSPGNHSSSVLPNATDSISLYIRATWNIVYPGALTMGPHSPISLNVTGVLWNGDPYYSIFDNSVWHSRSSSDAYYQLVPNVPVNSTWPYVWQVTFWNRSSVGTPSWFAGMNINWWIYLVSRGTGNTYYGWASPSFSYTVAGAWPSSPYPQAAQYGGANASTTDLSIRQVPLQPNWNDTVHITLSTTSADQQTRATIGATSLYVQERLANGAPYLSATFNFPVTVVGTTGATTTSVAIPSGYSQISGVQVSYWITSSDTALNEIDQITTPLFNYAIHSNGSFQNGQFANDLLLTTTPTQVELGGPPTPVVAPGQNVTITIQSRSAGASILTAVVDYTFTYNATGEVSNGQAAFVRNNSTTMHVVLPPFPLGSLVSFTVLAWDYQMLLDVSRAYTFETPTLAVLVPEIPANLTFFTVFVYDNSTANWVNGATVQIQDPTAYVNSVSTTQFGIAYPNETSARWTPLLVPANVNYNISVFDRAFIPAGDQVASQISVNLYATHAMANQGTLAQTDHYTVIQEGAGIFFYLNTSAPGPLFSPSSGTVVPLSAVLGLAGAFLGAIIIVPWWLNIQARRKAEEKRVTL